MWRARFLGLIAVVAASAFAAGAAAAQTGTITGTVTAAEGAAPLAGVQVFVVGTTMGAMTRDDGRYTITVAPGTYTVRATRLGFTPGAVTGVVVRAGQSSQVNFALQSTALLLESTVVIGYGTQQRERLTGSAAAITPEEFNTGRVVSADELIQAKVPGVQIANTGEPGGASNIRIRGGTSINASNEPLFVIDGIPLPVGGGLSSGRNPLNFLSPDDIAHISVLKDASATAIYGSRGANGVILIETKGGNSGGPQFQYSTSVSTSDILKEPDMLSAEQFRQVVTQRAPDRVKYLGSANTDWRSAVLRNAVGQEHNLAVSGAGTNMNYRLSLGYLDQAGVVRGSETERVSAALNYSHTLWDRLTIESTMRGARTADSYTAGGGLGNATIMDPTQPIRLATGGFFEHRDFQLAPTNPVAELELGTVEGTTYRAIGNVESRLQLPWVEGLSATARLGFDVASSERQSFFPATLFGQSRQPNPGFMDRSNPREATSLLETFATYNNRVEALRGDLEATVGYGYSQHRGDRPYFALSGLSTDLLGPNGVPAATEQRSTLFINESKTASFFGRINYSLLEKYILMLSVRRDGSSKFAPGNQWGTFPAAGVAWRMIDEGFLSGRPASLSDLKLRFSWGVNGNQTVGDYLWVANYLYSDPFARVQFGNDFVTTIRPSAVDPNIKWEETTSWNLGADYGFLDDRITGAIDYYVKDTDDLLFSVPVAAGTFVSNSVTTNIGSVRNSGIEFEIGGDLVRPASREGFRWNASFNAAKNKNELLRVNTVGSGTEQILTGDIDGGVGSNIQVLQPGYPVNSFFVYRHKRDAGGKPVATGDALAMYEDVNGDGIINQSDRVAYKSPAPEWILGHTSSLSYRNFDLSATLRAQLGSYVYNNLASQGGHLARLNEAAGPVNLHASVLEYGFTAPQYFSDVYVEDASFLRLDNLTIGYKVPRFRNAQLLRVYGTVQNAFTLTGYSGVDPMAGLLGIDRNLYPRSRTFSAGVTVGF